MALLDDGRVVSNFIVQALEESQSQFMEMENKLGLSVILRIQLKAFTN